MLQPDSSTVFMLASQFVAQPEESYGADELQLLCNAIEVVLRSFLAEDKRWSPYDWLDGFVATNVERTSDHLVVRGAVWVNAVRPEPCEVNIDVPRGGTPKATLRFSSTSEPREMTRPEKLKFPRQDWLYEFDLAA